MIEISNEKECPYCKKKLNLYVKRVADDGQDRDGMNSEIFIEGDLKCGREKENLE